MERIWRRSFVALCFSTSLTTERKPVTFWNDRTATNLFPSRPIWPWRRRPPMLGRRPARIVAKCRCLEYLPRRPPWPPVAAGSFLYMSTGGLRRGTSTHTLLGRRTSIHRLTTVVVMMLLIVVLSGRSAHSRSNPALAPPSPSPCLHRSFFGYRSEPCRHTTEGIGSPWQTMPKGSRCTTTSRKAERGLRLNFSFFFEQVSPNVGKN